MTSTAATEDDTSRILARPDIHRMVELHREWQKKRYTAGVYNTLGNIEFSKYYGWNWVEFLKAKKSAGYTY